jgi:hypothetical protein
VKYQVIQTRNKLHKRISKFFNVTKQHKQHLNLRSIKKMNCYSSFVITLKNSSEISQLEKAILAGHISPIRICLKKRSFFAPLDKVLVDWGNKYPELKQPISRYKYRHSDDACQTSKFTVKKISTGKEVLFVFLGVNSASIYHQILLIFNVVITFIILYIILSGLLVCEIIYL